MDIRSEPPDILAKSSLSCNSVAMPQNFEIPTKCHALMIFANFTSFATELMWLMMSLVTKKLVKETHIYYTYNFIQFHLAVLQF